MPTLPETAAHEVFHVEIWGDTLVLSPRGDAAGFTVHAVNSELATLNEVLRRDEVKHLVIDLGHANYYGSIILGALVQLGHVVEERRGRIALAAASDDMVGVLKLMKLDTMWEFYPTVQAALRAIAKIPVRQQVWAQRHLIATAVAIIALGLLFVYFPRIDYGKRYYVEVAKLWREAQAKRELAGDEEWKRFVERSEHKLQPMLEHMLRRSDSGHGTTLEIYLIYIIRDYWKTAMDRHNPQQQTYAAFVQYYLRAADAAIERRPAPSRAQFDDDSSESPSIKLP